MVQKTLFMEKPFLTGKSIFHAPHNSIVQWGYQDNFEPVYFFYEKVLSVKKANTHKNQLTKQN